jgi:hypothetical protein
VVAAAAVADPSAHPNADQTAASGLVVSGLVVSVLDYSRLVVVVDLLADVALAHALSSALLDSSA